MKKKIINFLVKFVLKKEIFWIVIMNYINKKVNDSGSSTAGEIYNGLVHFLASTIDFLINIGFSNKEILKMLKNVKRAHIKADGQTLEEFLKLVDFNVESKIKKQ